jgi:hypothetical protein
VFILKTLRIAPKLCKFRDRNGARQPAGGNCGAERGDFNTECTEITESIKNPGQRRGISEAPKGKSGKAAALGRIWIYPASRIANVIAGVKTIRMCHLFV